MRMSGGAAEDTVRNGDRKQQGRKCLALGVANRNIIGMRAAVLFVGDFDGIQKSSGVGLNSQVVVTCGLPQQSNSLEEPGQGKQKGETNDVEGIIALSDIQAAGGYYYSAECGWLLRILGPKRQLRARSPGTVYILLRVMIFSCWSARNVAMTWKWVIGRSEASANLRSCLPHGALPYHLI